MKNMMFAFGFSIISSYCVAGGGFSVGNGGDIIRCPILESYLSLDFVLVSTSKSKVANVESKEESFNRIGNILEKNIPELAGSYRNFTKLIFNENDLSQYYIWNQVSNLPDIQDEEFLNIPGVCGLPSYGPADMHQAVIREFVRTALYPLGQVTFSYDPQAIALLKNDPLQLSFLFTHEWLWNIALDAKANRAINYFLHSKEIDKLSVSEVRSRLKAFGAVIN
ncbi:MAG: hypothetical protein H7256_07720 [Bdellovibrio sp.]|nr:hypothetical protein [Bdellovibrio sp.]